MIALLNRLYRTIFFRGGYGVHSPFVFDLIRTVIEERKHYYCYEQLHSVRLQLLNRSGKVTYYHRACTIDKILRKYCFTEREYRLLFRLANRFHPKTIYVAGSDFGLTPLYLTAYAKDSVCVVIEPELSIAAIANEYLTKYALASVDLRNNITDIPDQLDFVVWGNSFTSFPSDKRTCKSSSQNSLCENFSSDNFERFLSHINDESVMVISGIHASPENHETWKSICSHSKVTVTIDLYRLGIVFFNSKLHRKTYKSVAF